MTHMADFCIITSCRPSSWDDILTDCCFSLLFRAPHLGRELVCKESKKNFKATIAMSQDFPLGIESWVFPLTWHVKLKQAAKTPSYSFLLACAQWRYSGKLLIFANDWRTDYLFSLYSLRTPALVLSFCIYIHCYSSILCSLISYRYFLKSVTLPLCISSRSVICQ